MGMPGLKARHILLEMVSSVQRLADLRRKKSRIGGFVGFHRRIADSVHIRIVPCYEGLNERVTRWMGIRRGSAIGQEAYVEAWWSFGGIRFGANEYVERAVYVTGVRG